jgi:NAD(P)-dependent dehydrogenase (short-subunit alcohol dehydrogenase family)
MGRFTEKIVVITGGTSGIGLAAAKQFITEGATVVVIGRSPGAVPSHLPASRQCRLAPDRFT